MRLRIDFSLHSVRTLYTPTSASMSKPLTR
jgi:hypothetical protein